MGGQSHKCEVFLKKTNIFLSKELQKDIKKGKIPEKILSSFNEWTILVLRNGIYATRKSPGYHDEPIVGSLIGRRSVRLSKGWRLFYIMNDKGECIILTVLEINKHDYS